MNSTHRRNQALGLGVLLATLCAGAPARAQDAHKELQALEKELQQEYKHLRQATREAADDGEAEAVYREFRATILPDLGARFAAFAEAHAGTELARVAWTKIVELAPQGLEGPLPVQALKKLAREHLKAPELAQVAMDLRYAVPALDEAMVLEALRAFVDGSPHRVVQASALYSLGAILGEHPDGDSHRAKAKDAFAKLAGYADVEFRSGQSFAEAAQTFVFALENLVVGKPCPDFEAVDAEGVAFKLSDYRGKVVLIDFWGFW
jgi:hypothetical protein